MFVTVLYMSMSLDGFIADDDDEVGPLFDWLGTGDVAWTLPGSDRAARRTQASADFMTSHYRDVAANVIGRRLFDLTNGWNGKPAAGEHAFVVTHRAPTDWEHARTAPFTFVDDVEEAIAAAREFAGDRDVDVARRPDRQPGARDSGSSTKWSSTWSRCSSAPAGRSSPPALSQNPLRLANPSVIVEGDRVTHLVYDEQPEPCERSEVRSELGGSV